MTGQWSQYFIPTAYATDSSGQGLSSGNQHTLSINVADLVFDSFTSIYRMFLALGLSFVVAIVVGITAALKPTFSKIVIPLVDILQSVPILGFFPAAVTFFITVFNGSPVGIELAAVFLIFTSMVWNMIFSVYESVLSIPSELQETVRAFRANPLLLFRRLYLPASTPKLIYNSIMSWAGGWYFLTAAEIISLGSKTYTLPGLGSLLATSVSAGLYVQALVTLAVLVGVILIIDVLFWRPLESYANRFKYEYSAASTAGRVARLSGRRVTLPLVQLSDFLIRYPRPVIHERSAKLIEAIEDSVYLFEQRIFPRAHKWFDIEGNIRLFKWVVLPVIAAFVISVIVLESGTITKSFYALVQMYVSLYSDPAARKIVLQIPLALVLSYFRLAAAYLITLAWTIPVAIKIARDPKFNRIMPVFQTFASIPATAFFPFMAILVNYVPGGLEFPSILLILTGMQWYMLFNLIGGVRSISGDIEEAAKAFRVTRGQYVRRVLFPSIYPSFITGSITAWGGGWNSLIVSEYLVFGNKTYSVLGIGSLLDTAAYDLGNTVLILLIVAVMVAVIVTVNRIVWRRFYKKVVQKYSMSG
jgi:NitT/TauT family transport system permease protein